MSEISQLVVIIVLLGVAYAGIRVWATRSKISTENAQSLGPDGQLLPKETDRDGEYLTDEMRQQIPKSNRNKDRFNLTGRDAEVAAKVLKRMLKQDGDKK